jgi:hypothetical protein
MYKSTMYSRRNKNIENTKNEIKLVSKNIEKLKKIALKKVEYSDYKEAYDYVDNLFPSCNVKEVKIYKVSIRDMEKKGFGGAEGFFDRLSKSIFLAGTRRPLKYIDKSMKMDVKITRDEVIVHELCHYCCDSSGVLFSSRDMNEEFAYGWSVGYLKNKGYSDEYIIKYNFFPHLINTFWEESYKIILSRSNISLREYKKCSKLEKKEFLKMNKNKILELAKEMSMERGQKIIDIYKGKINGAGQVETIKDNDGRFGMLDI